MVSTPFARMSSPPALSPIQASHVAGEDDPGDGYNGEYAGPSNELGTCATVGEFTATRVAAAQHAIS